MRRFSLIIIATFQAVMLLSTEQLSQQTKRIMIRTCLKVNQHCQIKISY